jgi:hypothetical protein
VRLRLRKRRVEGVRFGGAPAAATGERGGEFGPRRADRRARALPQRVQGELCDSPMWPQPLCWTKLWWHISFIFFIFFDAGRPLGWGGCFER